MSTVSSENLDDPLSERASKLMDEDREIDQFLRAFAGMFSGTLDTIRETDPTDIVVEIDILPTDHRTVD